MSAYALVSDRKSCPNYVLLYRTVLASLGPYERYGRIPAIVVFSTEALMRTVIYDRGCRGKTDKPEQNPKNSLTVMLEVLLSVRE